jgi:hypothetical protein
MGYGRFSPTSIEAVERRIMLSADPVTDVMVAPDSDAGIADQIATYSSQSSDQAEEYALQVEEAYLDPTQEGLELAMEEFFADSSEAASDYDPYAGLSESPVGVYLAGYDSELSSINPSSAIHMRAATRSSSPVMMAARLLTVQRQATVLDRVSVLSRRRSLITTIRSACMQTT